MTSAIHAFRELPRPSIVRNTDIAQSFDHIVVSVNIVVVKAPYQWKLHARVLTLRVSSPLSIRARACVCVCVCVCFPKIQGEERTKYK